MNEKEKNLLKNIMDCNKLIEKTLKDFIDNLQVDDETKKEFVNAWLDSIMRF